MAFTKPTDPTPGVTLEQITEALFPGDPNAVPPLPAVEITKPEPAIHLLNARTVEAIRTYVIAVAEGVVDHDQAIEALQAALAGKADDSDLADLVTSTQLQQGLAGRATQADIAAAIDALKAGAPAAYDTLLEIAAELTRGGTAETAILAALDKKLDSSAAAVDAAVAARLTDPASATRAAGVAAFLPRWAPSTAYQANVIVLAPSGEIVKATTGYTSGATYNAANWTVVAGGIGAGSGSSAAAQPLARGFDPATDTAWSGTTPKLVRLNNGAAVISGTKQSPDTHYNWSVIATAGVISNPVDAYYAYDSPDHGGAGTNGSGIRWYTAPAPAGPWTHRRADGTAVGVGNPLEYVYRDPNPVETETPLVFSYPQTDGKNLHLFYQEKSAGPQVTRLARSSDGRTWTREPGFELQSGGDHSGYMRIARWGRRFLGWSRATSGSGLAPDVCMQWHCIGDPKLASSWVQDSRRLLNHEDATGPGWSINWANMSPFTWYGRTWAFTQLFPVGKSANPSLGIAETDRRFVLLPMSADLRRVVGPAVDALAFQGTEVPPAGDPGWRTTQAFTDTDGTIYIYYITSDDVYVAKVV